MHLLGYWIDEIATLNFCFGLPFQSVDATFYFLTIERGIEYEIQTEDLLLRYSKGVDVGPLATW